MAVLTAPRGIDGWIAERFTSGELSPTDLALNKVRDILRADQRLVEFADGNPARIQAFSFFQPLDFSLIPGIALWPELTVSTPSAGVVLMQARINVALRLYVGEVNPLGAWSPGISTLLYHLYRVLFTHQGLPHLIAGDSVDLADRCDFDDERSQLDRPSPNGPYVMTVGRTVTYHITTDPVTGQPWNIALYGEPEP